MTPIVVTLSIVLPGLGLVAVVAEVYRTSAASGVWFESAKVDGRALTDRELETHFPAGSPQWNAVIQAARVAPVPAVVPMLSAADIDRADAHADRWRRGSTSRVPR